MSEVVALSAETRENTGKGPARALRREGRIPGIIYGGKGDQQKVSLELREMNRVYLKGGFQSRLVDLKIGKDTVRVIPREVQVHPVTDVPEHADFLRVDKNTPVKVWVKVRFENEDLAPGIKRGGVLNVVRHEIEFYCSPESIPESIIVDLTGMVIGDSVHFSKLPIPEGVVPVIDDRDFTVATVVGRGIKSDEDEEEGEGEEGEEGEGEEGEESEENGNGKD